MCSTWIKIGDASLFSGGSYDFGIFFWHGGDALTQQAQWLSSSSHRELVPLLRTSFSKVVSYLKPPRAYFNSWVIDIVNNSLIFHNPFLRRNRLILRFGVVVSIIRPIQRVKWGMMQKLPWVNCPIKTILSSWILVLLCVSNVLRVSLCTLTF